MTQTREGLVVFGLGIVIALMGMAMELDVATYIGGGIALLGLGMWMVRDAHDRRDAER
jgi:hypothetical protein